MKGVPKFSPMPTIVAGTNATLPRIGGARVAVEPANVPAQREASAEKAEARIAELEAQLDEGERWYHEGLTLRARVAELEEAIEIAADVLPLDPQRVKAMLRRHLKRGHAPSPPPARLDADGTAKPKTEEPALSSEDWKDIANGRDEPVEVWTNDHHTAQAWLAKHIGRGHAMGDAVDALVDLIREQRGSHAWGLDDLRTFQEQNIELNDECVRLEKRIAELETKFATLAKAALALAKAALALANGKQSRATVQALSSWGMESAAGRKEQADFEALLEAVRNAAGSTIAGCEDDNAEVALPATGIEREEEEWKR